MFVQVCAMHKYVCAVFAHVRACSRSVRACSRSVRACLYSVRACSCSVRACLYSVRSCSCNVRACLCSLVHAQYHSTLLRQPLPLRSFFLYILYKERAISCMYDVCLSFPLSTLNVVHAFHCPWHAAWHLAVVTGVVSLYLVTPVQCGPYLKKIVSFMTARLIIEIGATSARAHQNNISPN